MITQEELHRLFEYDTQTGEFIRKVRTARATSIGEKAGYLNNIGYVQMRVECNNYLAHRLAWLYMHGEIPEIIDHIDGNRSNNAIENLRVADICINGFNREKKSKSSSIFKGVTWSKKYKKWESNITCRGKRKHIGYFHCEQEAGHAYNKASIELHGEYARLNPVGAKEGE